MFTITGMIITVSTAITTIGCILRIITNMRVYFYGFTGREEKPYTVQEEQKNFELLEYNPITNTYEK